MKIGAFIVCLLFLFPFQATLLYSLSPWGIRPDLCLITACLVGVWAGRARGAVVGVVLGFIQDLFSVSALWLNLLTKAGSGFLTGTFTKNLSNMDSPLVFFPVAALSFVWGIVLWLSSRTGTGEMLYSGGHDSVSSSGAGRTGGRRHQLGDCAVDGQRSGR